MTSYLLEVTVACTFFLQVGAKSLETGVWGAYQNVMINLEDLAESEIKSTVRMISFLQKPFTSLLA